MNMGKRRRGIKGKRRRNNEI